MLLLLYGMRYVNVLYRIENGADDVTGLCGFSKHTERLQNGKSMGRC